MNFRSCLLGLALLLMVAGGGQAAEVTGLYEASVVVPDRSAGARKTGLETALRRVLVRVSGSSAILQQPALETAVANAGRYLVQYGYRTEELPPDATRQTPQRAILLSATFDERAVNQFLRREGFPIWAANRPSVLVWAAVADAAGRKWVGGDSKPGVQAQLQQQARRRGLPLLFPAYDRQDRRQVQAGDIWGMFVDPIVAASGRYNADTVVVAKIQHTGGSVYISAALSIDQHQQWWELSAADMDQALTDFMDQLADRVGERYAVQMSAAQGELVTLDVAGLERLQDYAALEDYLDGLLSVRAWHLLQVQGPRHQYRIVLDTTREALEQSLRLDRKLIPRAAPDPGQDIFQPARSGAGPELDAAAVGTADGASAVTGAQDAGPMPAGPPAAGAAGSMPAAAAGTGSGLAPAPEPAKAPEPPVLHYRWNG
ncbi:MAG: DUF2066 domain-containing protein [Pseudomonadota bacterium]|nr:DUF2066 domain-containing protein [Pseudomonadota bacterium]